MLSEQNEYIQDVKSIEETNTTAKAEELMGKFGDLLGASNEQDDELASLKTKYSEVKDDNLKLVDEVKQLQAQVKQLQDVDGEGEATVSMLNDVQPDSAQTEELNRVKDDLKEYESMVEKKEKLISDLQTQLKTTNSEIEAIEIDHQNRRKKAQELILEKDKEIDRLKQHKKKIDDQYRNLKKTFDQISNPNQTSRVTITEDDASTNPKLEGSKESIEDGSSSDTPPITSKNPPKITDTVILSEDSSNLDKAMSYQIEEQYKDKI